MKKYRNEKTTIDGIPFSSKREAFRYCDLRILEKAGKIHGLRLQVPFELAPSVKIAGRMRPPLRYIADFVYLEHGVPVVEDCKGYRTDVYKIKRHLMATVHSIHIRET